MATPIFDRIADVYDDTRRALDDEALRGILEMLTEYGCRSVLEIGIGTGRIAIPLSRNGYEVIGMDISRRMMEKAKAKGLRSLFLAEGSRAPFREKSFDATLMAHVFHLLDEPFPVMKEAARVSRVGVFALLRRRTETHSLMMIDDDSATDAQTKKFLEERRERFRKIFRKYGQTPTRLFPNWKREQEILTTHPPDELKVVSDTVVTMSMEERINRFENGSYSSMLRMPDEMRKEIIAEMRSSYFSQSYPKTQPRHEVYQLALWRSDRLLA